MKITLSIISPQIFWEGIQIWIFVGDIKSRDTFARNITVLFRTGEYINLEDSLLQTLLVIDLLVKLIAMWSITSCIYINAVLIGAIKKNCKYFTLNSKSQNQQNAKRPFLFLIKQQSLHYCVWIIIWLCFTANNKSYLIK